MDLIEDKELNLLAARGLAKFEVLRLAKGWPLAMRGFGRGPVGSDRVPVQSLRMG